MSQRLNLVPASVKKHDVERQSYRRVAPIPFLKPSSEEDTMETDDNSHKIKVYIDQNSSEYIKPFRGGVNEDYLSYLILVQDTIRKKQIETRFGGYKSEYLAASTELDEHNKKKPKSKEWDLVEETESSPSVTSGNTQSKKRKKQAKTKGNIWSAREITLKDKKRNVKACMDSIISEAFELYKMLLCEEMCVSWQ